MEPKARGVPARRSGSAGLSDARTAQVVAAAVRSGPQRGWAFDERAALTFESGSGNNWARGYNTYGPKFRSRACDLLRREVRFLRGRCRPSPPLLTQNRAWRRRRRATSSADFCCCRASRAAPGLVWEHISWRRCGALRLGCRVDACAVPHARLRDEYPAACVLSQCIWPYESGEVVVQNYNTLLTLATLLDAADGIIVVQNEALHAAANKLLNVARHGCACHARQYPRR